MTDQRPAGRELNIRIAQLLGYEVRCWPEDGVPYLALDDGPERLPDYSTDMAAARLVETEIERLGLCNAYAEALIRLTCGDNADIFNSAIEIDTHHGYDGWRVVFAIAHATPEQRCQAALTAVGREGM